MLKGELPQMAKQKHPLGVREVRRSIREFRAAKMDENPKFGYIFCQITTRIILAGMITRYSRVAALTYSLRKALVLQKRGSTALAV